MSEYQYYEFRAIDRPLDQQADGRAPRLSTRAEITPTSFTNSYHWGDFKGKPSALMDRYFDAFVYVANWGTHRLMLRIPRGFLDVDIVQAYCDGEVVSLTAGKEHVVIEFSSQDESGDEWTEGEHWMPSLVSIRDELMRGDLRALYLGWLASLPARGWDDEDVDDDEREPPSLPAWRSCRHRYGRWPTSCVSMTSCSKRPRPAAPANPPPRPPGRRWRGGSSRFPPPRRTPTW